MNMTHSSDHLPIPLPSYIVHNNNHPTIASSAKNHHTPPMKLYCSPNPNPQPPTNGPSVRAPLDTLCATPWIVPRTAGFVTQLLTRMIPAGSAKVREITCSAATKVNAGQTSAGFRGMSTRKGANAYAIAEKGRNVRKEDNVPILACMPG